MIRTIFLVIFSFYTVFACAETGEEKPYRPGESIFEHLGDEYGWTMVLPKGKSIYLPLPVIVTLAVPEESSMTMTNGLVIVNK